MLVRKGRYTLGQPVAAWRADLLDVGLTEAPLDDLVTGRAGEFVNLHEDPADRFIAATAIRLGAKLVSSDRRLIDWANSAGSAGGMDAQA